MILQRMPKPFTKTVRNKKPKAPKEKKKKTKRDIFREEVERFDLSYILEEYRPRVKSPTWKCFADRVYADYICIISADETWIVQCCTCLKTGKWNDPGMQDGHYRNRWHLKTRYEDTNNHVQCYACNVALKGNYRQYHLFMVGKYGKEYEERLRTNKETHKVRNFEYVEMIRGWYTIIQEKISSLTQLREL